MKLKKLLSLLLSVMMILVMFNSLIVVSAADGSSVIEVPLKDSLVTWYSNEWPKTSNTPYIPEHVPTYWNAIGARCSGVSATKSGYSVIAPTKEDTTKERYKLLSVGFGMEFDATQIPDLDLIKSATVKVKVKKNSNGYTTNFQHNTFLYPMANVVYYDTPNVSDMRIGSLTGRGVWHSYTDADYKEKGAMKDDGSWNKTTDGYLAFANMYADTSKFGEKYPNIDNLIGNEIDTNTFAQLTGSAVIEYDVTDYLLKNNTPSFILINDNGREEDWNKDGWNNNTFSLDTSSYDGRNSCATLVIETISDAEVLEKIKTAADSTMPKYINLLLGEKTNEVLLYNRLSDTDKTAVNNTIRTGTYADVDALRTALNNALAPYKASGEEIVVKLTDATVTWHDPEQRWLPVHREGYSNLIGARSSGAGSYTVGLIHGAEGSAMHTLVSVGYGMMFDETKLPDLAFVKSATVKVNVKANANNTNNNVFNTAIYPMAPIVRGDKLATFMTHFRHAGKDVIETNSDGSIKTKGYPNAVATQGQFASWKNLPAITLESWQTTGDDNQTTDVTETDVKIWNTDYVNDYIAAYKDYSDIEGYPNLNGLTAVNTVDFTLTPNASATVEYDVTDYIKAGKAPKGDKI